MVSNLLEKVYFYGHESGQMFIAIGALESPETVFLLDCRRDGCFFIAHEKDCEDIREMISSSSEYVEKEVPLQVLRRLLEIVKNLKEKGEDTSLELNLEMTELGKWVDLG